MPAFLKKRDNILVLAFGLVLVFFIGRMLQMQLIQGDEYESQIYKGTIKTQTVEAAGVRSPTGTAIPLSPTG